MNISDSVLIIDDEVQIRRLLEITLSSNDFNTYFAADGKQGLIAAATHNPSLIRPYVFENQHIYEIVDLFAKLKLTIVPVLDANKKYLGSITLHNIVTEFAKMITVEKAGGIIILEMTIHDYCLSEIAQIVESNNAKILSLFVNTIEASTAISITIKVDVTDMASIIQTFERYDYKIKASFLSEDMLKVFYQDRLDSFLNYLNI